MKAKVIVPTIAVAALIGAGIYAENVHRHHMNEMQTASTIPADSQAAPADTARPTPKPAVHHAVKPRANSQLATNNAPATTAPARQLLPEGGLVKITGKVTETDATALTVKTGDAGEQVQVELKSNRDWYWPYAADHSDKPGIGSVVTVYGRAHDVVSSEPKVDADAVYLPDSGTMYYSNGKNQTSTETVGERSRVRFTAYYRVAG